MEYLFGTSLAHAYYKIGNREFVQKAISADMQRRARLKEYAIMGVTLDTIVTEVIKLYNLSKKKIKIRGRNNTQSDTRKEFAFAANRQYQFPACEIAGYLDISSQSVSNLIREGERVMIGTES